MTTAVVASLIGAEFGSWPDTDVGKANGPIGSGAVPICCNYSLLQTQ
jgi:hypothetical protein